MYITNYKYNVYRVTDAETTSLLPCDHTRRSDGVTLTIALALLSERRGSVSDAAVLVGCGAAAA